MHSNWITLSYYSSPKHKNQLSSKMATNIANNKFQVEDWPKLSSVWILMQVFILNGGAMVVFLWFLVIVTIQHCYRDGQEHVQVENWSKFDGV